MEPEALRLQLAVVAWWKRSWCLGGRQAARVAFVHVGPRLALKVRTAWTAAKAELMCSDGWRAPLRSLAAPVLLEISLMLRCEN